jgi:hypothetical protein
LTFYIRFTFLYAISFYVHFSLFVPFLRTRRTLVPGTEVLLMSIIFLEWGKKITVGLGKEASSPHIITSLYVYTVKHSVLNLVCYLTAMRTALCTRVHSIHTAMRKVVLDRPGRRWRAKVSLSEMDWTEWALDPRWNFTL